MCVPSSSFSVPTPKPKAEHRQNQPARLQGFALLPLHTEYWTSYVLVLIRDRAQIRSLNTKRPPTPLAPQASWVIAYRATGEHGHIQPFRDLVTFDICAVCQILSIPPDPSPVHHHHRHHHHHVKTSRRQNVNLIMGNLVCALGRSDRLARHEQRGTRLAAGGSDSDRYMSLPISIFMSPC